MAQPSSSPKTQIQIYRSAVFVCSPRLLAAACSETPLSFIYNFLGFFLLCKEKDIDKHNRQNIVHVHVEEILVERMDAHLVEKE